MNRLEEIKKRKTELRELLEDESKEVNLDEVKSELDSLDAEEKQLIADEEVKKDEEQRKERAEIAKSLEKRDTKSVKKVEERKMNEEKKFTISSPEYRTAWAKKLLKYPEDKFTEDELRALGDAVTTTATEYVAATADANGVNNGGLLIPTSVRTDILNLIAKVSPFFNDVRKFQVAGNMELPFLNEADDATWYAENTDTDNEGQNYASVKLTGNELAKDVVVTWKLEAMAVESFIPFIEQEIANKMGKALIKAILYGDGNNKATGALHGLDAVKGEDPIDTIVKTYKSLKDDFRIGAKAYISTDVNIDIVGYKDNNGNYPFINGVPTNKLCNIEVDPFLEGGDILVGNPSYYILNESEPLSIARESHVKGRKTTYGGYMVADGKPRPNAFAKGQYVPTV